MKRQLSKKELNSANGGKVEWANLSNNSKRELLEVYHKNYLALAKEVNSSAKSANDRECGIQMAANYTCFSARNIGAKFTIEQIMTGKL